ncbi:MAG TPA: bifunctional riboflavin kinase/FAD synthetase [Polyangiaceae bacterium]|jgi:riboflavin kinase/FMN adenylyltransferase|nr:bifunctional riboflavin kinase/FAD synthetase [Polyangiaceae bacterium]
MTATLQTDVADGATRESVAADPCVLVIGNFDGVHKGHQAVLHQAVGEARSAGLAACALTFHPHPGEIVGAGAPPLLTSMRDRAVLMESLGVERVYVRRFDRAFAAWSPERFAIELVAGALAARAVVVGQDFRFGAKRAGDLEQLRALGREHGFAVRVAGVASDVSGPYSSTRVRDALAAGDLRGASAVLGRPHSLSGAVVHGDARGRTLGFPTANLANIVEMLPADGIYAVTVERRDDEGAVVPLDGGTRPVHGVMSIGVRPTIGTSHRTVEAHLLGFTGDLYGANLRVALIARLRDEKKFASLDELKAQIARDAVEAQSVLTLGMGSGSEVGVP